MKCVEGLGGRGLVVRVLALMLTRSKVCVCLSVGPAKVPGEGWKPKGAKLDAD